jgi:predicted DNA-binding transcriptional regulator AlpA
MRLRRQIVITAEKTETYTVRQEPPSFSPMYCEKCNQEVRCLTLDQTVKVTGLGARTIFRLVEAGVLHSDETDNDHLLLCPNSVALFVRLSGDASPVPEI